MPDPNWLYSTTAQCAAAIVAIIGGFLVSSLVSLSSERSGLQRRRTELEQTVARYQFEVDDLDADIYWQVQDWFVDAYVDEYVAAEGTPDIGRIAEESNYFGSDPDMAYTIAQWLRDMVVGACALNRVDPDGLLAHLDSPAWLRAHGVPVKDGDEAFVATVAKSLRQPVRPAVAAFTTSPWGTPGR